MNPARPNIVIFNPDSYRGDVLGHLGNPAAVSPNFDALVANGGVSYANAFAQNPVCTPSRCSFMTGWYPHVHGHRSMKNMLKPHEPSLLSVLRREGYHVWWGGKNDLVAVARPEDYLQYCDTKHAPQEAGAAYAAPPPLAADDPRGRVFYRGLCRRTADGQRQRDSDRAHTSGAVEFIRTAADRAPWCVFLPLEGPHPPYQVEEEFYDCIDPHRLPPRLPVAERGPPALDAYRAAYRSENVSEADWQEIRRVYYGMCAKIDFLFGQVVGALQEAGLYDSTLIVALSDHGDFAGDYGLPEKTHLSLQDALLRSPLLIKPPASSGARAGVRTHLTELLDVSATIYDLLGIDPGYDGQGRSLVRSLQGEDREIREAVFAEVGARAGEAGFCNLDVLRLPEDSFYRIQSSAALPAHRAGSLAVSCRTRRHKYVRRGYNGHHELYDLESDPGECHNLCGLAPCAALERDMERRLLDFFMTTADVLPRQQDRRGI